MRDSDLTTRGGALRFIVVRLAPWVLLVLIVCIADERCSASADKHHVEGCGARP